MTSLAHFSMQHGGKLVLTIALFVILAVFLIGCWRMR